MKTVSGTIKNYTVVLQCCDPPVNVDYFNTNSLQRARFVFAYFKNQEVLYEGGGEFDIALWQHKNGSGKRIVTMSTVDDSSKEPFVYNMDFPESIKLDSFSYMDLPRYATTESK